MVTKIPSPSSFGIEEEEETKVLELQAQFVTVKAEMGDDPSSC